MPTDVRYHILGHTPVVGRAWAGVSASSLKKLLGHNRPETTQMHRNISPEYAVRELRKKVVPKPDAGNRLSSRSTVRRPRKDGMLATATKSNFVIVSNCDTHDSAWAPSPGSVFIRAQLGLISPILWAIDPGSVTRMALRAYGRAVRAILNERADCNC